MAERTVQMLHFDSVLVNVNDVVTQGQILAVEGNTGYSFGDHVHISVIPQTRLTNWNGSDSLGLGAKRSYIVDEFLQGFTANFMKFNNAFIPYYNTAGWWGIDSNSYEGHYAIDVDHGGPDENKPFICWPLPYNGIVRVADNIDDGAWGKNLVITYDYGGSVLPVTSAREDEEKKKWILMMGKSKHY